MMFGLSKTKNKIDEIEDALLSLTQIIDDFRNKVTRNVSDLRSDVSDLRGKLPGNPKHERRGMLWEDLKPLIENISNIEMRLSQIEKNQEKLASHLRDIECQIDEK